MRLNLSVGGWELPSGRNAKGCLDSVKPTAGEFPNEERKNEAERERKKRKRGDILCLLLSSRVDAVKCEPRPRFERWIFQNAAKPSGLSGLTLKKKTSFKYVDSSAPVPVATSAHTRGFPKKLLECHSDVKSV